ncbi:aminotransferase class V-fold PLP-dependent enzyme [Thermopirellula anaerolimosa]
MTTSQRVYLDNAATSWPKPEAVYRAVDEYQRRLGCSPGRGVYRDASCADQVVADARHRVAGLWDVEDPLHVIFTFNGSDALNLAIRGAIRPGDHAVTTAADHNSVLRPLRFLEETQGVQVTRVPCDAVGRVDVAAFAQAVQARTRLVAVNHASNVTGTLQNISRLVEVVRRRSPDALVLVDAAQSLGHLPLSVREWGVDLAAAPGHKGLLGPMGTGVLYIRPGVEERIAPLRLGGTGSQSDEDRQPAMLPDKYEPGNHNASGLAGLAAGAAWLEERTLSALRRHELSLIETLLERLRGIPGLTLYGPEDPAERVGVVSFRLQGFEPHELAALLDLRYGIQVRSGIHCAPRMHAALGTLKLGGTVRISTGPFTTPEELEYVTQALRELSRAA